MSKVAATLEPATGTTGFFNLLPVVNNYALNENGDLAFRSIVTGGPPSSDGIWIGNSSTPPTKLLVNNDLTGSSLGGSFGVRSLAASDASRLNPDLYISVAELDSSVPARTVREWLREREPNLDQLIIVSWTAQAAIVTTWGVFTEYWDDFCYPASDDVMISPISEAWALLYHHEEQFYYGERRA